jgi:hypothetical protein
MTGAKHLQTKFMPRRVEPIADARIGDDTDSFIPGNGRAFDGGIAWLGERSALGLHAYWDTVKGGND